MDWEDFFKFQQPSQKASTFSFMHFFEDCTKIKILSEIQSPLTLHSTKYLISYTQKVFGAQIQLQCRHQATAPQEFATYLLKLDAGTRQFCSQNFLLNLYLFLTWSKIVHLFQNFDWLKDKRKKKSLNQFRIWNSFLNFA